MTEAIIQLAGLTKIYGEQTAVDHLTLNINKGEIFGLLGPNGAGKSTTILMILGLSEPASGAVRVCGYDSTREPILVKRKVGYLPDDIGFYEELTGLQNLLYTARLNSIEDREAIRRAEELLTRVGLADAAEKKVGAYSRGMRQRLGLADVLIKQPEVIILDEPTLGIDPEGVRELLALIQKLSRDEGITVLLSSHHLHQVQQICDRVGLFVKGKLLAEGDVATLSGQLFANELISIEVGIPSLAEIPDTLLDQWRAIPGVETMEEADGRLLFQCSRDMTAELSRAIIDADYTLSHLVKKEYGLDEIYHRYFEGGETDGKHRKSIQAG